MRYNKLPIIRSFLTKGTSLSLKYLAISRNLLGMPSSSPAKPAGCVANLIII